MLNPIGKMFQVLNTPVKLWSSKPASCSDWLVDGSVILSPEGLYSKIYYAVHHQRRHLHLTVQYWQLAIAWNFTYLFILKYKPDISY